MKRLYILMLCLQFVSFSNKDINLEIKTETKISPVFKINDINRLSLEKVGYNVKLVDLNFKYKDMVYLETGLKSLRENAKLNDWDADIDYKDIEKRKKNHDLMLKFKLGYKSPVLNNIKYIGDITYYLDDFYAKRSIDKDSKEVKDIQRKSEYIEENGEKQAVGNFMADLIREIKKPLVIDFMEVSSYGDDFVSSKDIKIIKDLDYSVRGKNILIVEDIIDSGLTLKKILQLIGKRGPKNVILCTLLNKNVNREVDLEIQYVGFEIPNEFVLGYGLDFKQEYRNIPYIGIMNLEEYYRED